MMTTAKSRLRDADKPCVKRYFPQVRHPRLILGAIVLAATACSLALTAWNRGRQATERLLIAIEAADVAAVRDAIAAGADVNDSREVIDPPVLGRRFRETWKGVTPLYRAAACGEPAIVRLLIDAGAATEAVIEPPRWTSLHRACLFGDEPTVIALLDGGASIDVQDGLGRTPLDLAMKRRMFSRPMLERLGMAPLHTVER